MSISQRRGGGMGGEKGEGEERKTEHIIIIYNQ